MTLWMRVSKDKYRFPEVIADSLEELARLCGVSEKTVLATISHEKHGRMRSKYKKVIIDEEDEEKMRQFKTGDRVRVEFNSMMRCGITGDMWKYNYRVMTIKAVKLIGKYETVYELDGAVSKMGVPFTFDKSWLSKERAE